MKPKPEIYEQWRERVHASMERSCPGFFKVGMDSAARWFNLPPSGKQVQSASQFNINRKGIVKAQIKESERKGE